MGEDENQDLEHECCEQGATADGQPLGNLAVDGREEVADDADHRDEGEPDAGQKNLQDPDLLSRNSRGCGYESHRVLGFFLLLLFSFPFSPHNKLVEGPKSGPSKRCISSNYAVNQK